MKRNPFLAAFLYAITISVVFTSCKNQPEGVHRKPPGSNSNFPTSFSISPDEGEAGRIITIDLKNGGIDSATSIFDVTLGNAPVDILSDSANILKLQVPKGITPGSYTVTVSGKDEGWKLSKHFKVVPYNTIGEHHVLLFGIDGLQFRKIAPLNTPNLDSLYTTKAFTGGITGTATEQDTWSGPGWMSILNGVWADKHTVEGNCTGCYSDEAKSVFTYIRENKPASYLAAIVTWRPIFQFLGTQMNNVDYKWWGTWHRGNKIDSIGVDKAVNQIIHKGPDFIFDYIVNVDDIAHQEGFGPYYNKAIETADKQLGRLLDAIRKRKQSHTENWLVIVVTDHGRKAPGGYSHGGQSKSEKTIFIKMNKKGNDYFNTKNTAIPNKDFDGLYGYPAQTSVTPTILRFLGIDIQDDGFASPPLIGKDGPRNLMFQGSAHKKLYWLSHSSSNAVILKRVKRLVKFLPARVVLPIQQRM